MPPTAEEKDEASISHDPELRAQHDAWEDPHGDAWWMSKWHLRLPECDRALLRSLRAGDLDGVRAALDGGADVECMPGGIEPSRASISRSVHERAAAEPPIHMNTGHMMFEPPLFMALRMCDSPAFSDASFRNYFMDDSAG